MLEGKVAFITGAAGGIGRAHAVQFARPGAGVVIVDIGRNMDTVAYPLGTNDLLEETAALVREAGGTVVSALADVRDQGQLDAAAKRGLDEFGHIDILVANAGILS